MTKILLLIPIAAPLFVLLFNKTYYALPVYYLGRFALGIVLSGQRVRVQTIYQLILIAFCMSACLLKNCLSNRGNKTCARLHQFEVAKYIIAIVTIVECVNGVFKGYLTIQIMIDAYKVLEIILFYEFIRMTWHTEEEAHKSLSILFMEMCLLGIYEMFTTERGGIGLNICMSLFPFLFTFGFFNKTKYYWIEVIISVAIVVVSLTRTYWGGFLLGILVVLLFARGKQRSNVISIGIVLLIMTVLGLVLYKDLFGNNTLFSTITSRFLTLFEGFESAGQYRIYETQLALQKFTEHPIFGLGYGYLENVYIKLMGYFEWGDFMHNAYAEVLAKTGLFGSIIYGLCLVALILGSYNKIQYYRHVGNSNCMMYSIAGLAGLCSWLLVYFAAPLSSYGYVFIPSIIGGLLCKLNQRNDNSQYYCQ